MGLFSLLAPTTTRHWVFLASICISFAAVTVAPVAAQTSPAEAEARSVFDAGQVAFTAGHYADALEYFKRSYALSRRPALLFNIGLCHDRLREDAEAIEAYSGYLAEVPRAANRAEVDGRLEALRAAWTRREHAAREVAPEHVAQAAGGTSASVEMVASASAETGANASPARDVPADSPAVYETWWFWTIVGVVVTGGAVGIGVAMSGDAPLQSGDVGGVLFALGSGR